MAMFYFFSKTQVNAIIYKIYNQYILTTWLYL